MTAAWLALVVLSSIYLNTRASMSRRSGGIDAPWTSRRNQAVLITLALQNRLMGWEHS